MRRQFPYKTVPCEHCRPEDADCDFCDGSHREIRRIEDLDTVKTAVNEWLQAARKYLEAVGRLGA
jgi:hypothetical protein